MKKTLLFITVLLAMAGTSSAQDIWSTVKRWNRNHMEAALYKNAQQKLFFSPGYEPVEALVLNGHTYFAYVNNSQGGFIADYTTSNTTTYLETGAGSWIEDIFPGGNGTGVYAVGEKNVGELIQAAVWKDGTLQLLGDGTHSSYGFCGCVGEDDKIYVGGQMYDEDAFYATIWYDGELLYSFPDGSIEDIAFYDGNVYSALSYYNSNYYVYKNDEMIYDLNIGYNDEVRGMFIEGGDIYLIGEKDFYEVVWKNGEIFIGGYNTPFYSRDIDNIWVNSDGVYLEYGGSFGSSSSVIVWKNNETFLHITNGLGENISIGKWFVEPLECENTFSRRLPYFEGFEMGETDWECWTKIDVDGDNGGSASCWERGGKSEGLNTKFPHTGDHVAIHRNAASGRPQEGWLISPALDLQWSYETTLSFYSCNEYSSSYNSGYEGVWITTDSDPYNLSSYTELWHPSSVTSSWEQVTIDLSDYAGVDVAYIAFKYTGNGAHEWLIDDINITENVWTPCEPITDFPFEEHFDTDPFVNGSCWYRLDIDINNGEYGSYWNWYDDNECVWHQFGPSGVEQEGWLFSPSLQLELGRDYTLSFNSSFSYPDDYGESSVWIALDYGGEPYPFYYTKIWEETHPTEEWVQHTIDLSAYAGSTVNIAFKYEGTYAHAWYVDDIVISEGPANSVDENGITALSLYPNPARETLRIKGLENNSELLFYNTLGMLVKRATASADEEISVSDLAPGLYLIRCNSQTIRFVKK